MEWDGTGKHPILKMTMEEIRAWNETIPDRVVARAKSSSAKKPASYDQHVMLAIEHNATSAEYLKLVFSAIGSSVGY